jgi:hypothetical protein
LEAALKYLTRKEQREYLRNAHNIPLGESALENKAYKGSGPKEVFINGRALSTATWLDDWVAEQAARPIVRRRSQRAAQDAAAA